MKKVKKLIVGNWKMNPVDEDKARSIVSLVKKVSLKLKKSEVVVSVIAWSAARFSDGKIYLPKSYISLGILGVTVSVLISSIVSSSSKLSFFGVMLDIGTFWFMLSAFVLMFMSSIMIRDEKKARLVLTGLAFSSLFLSIFEYCPVCKLFKLSYC
jgi:hypothetical protein